MLVRHNPSFPLVIILILLLPLSGVGSPIKALYVLVFLVAGVVGFILCLIRAVNFRDGFAIATIGFAISIILSSSYNISRYELSSARDLVAFVLVVFLPFLVYSAVKEAWHKTTIVYVFFITAILNFAVGIIQLIQGVDPVFGNPPVGGRMTGYFSWGAPVVGSFTGAVVPLIYGRFLRGAGGVHALFLVAFYVIILVGGNRSMLVSALVGHIVVALFFSSGSRKVLWGELLVIFAGVFFLGSLLFVYAQEYLSSNVLSRIVSLGGDIIEEQKSKRIATWVQTICMISDHPYFGVGYGNYEVTLPQYFSCALMSEGSMPHPHQVYLDLLSTLGFVGFLIFCVYCTSLFFIALSCNNESRRVEGLLIIFIFFSPLNVTHGLISLWWAIIVFTLVGLVLVNKKLESVVK